MQEKTWIIDAIFLSCSFQRWSTSAVCRPFFDGWSVHPSFKASVGVRKKFFPAHWIVIIFPVCIAHFSVNKIIMQSVACSMNFLQWILTTIRLFRWNNTLRVRSLSISLYSKAISSFEMFLRRDKTFFIYSWKFLDLSFYFIVKTLLWNDLTGSKQQITGWTVNENKIWSGSKTSITQTF